MMMSVNRMWWHYMSLIIILGVLHINFVEGVAATNVSCSSVRTKYHGTGIQDQIPITPVSGHSLDLCEPTEVTCCTPSVESSLSVQSRMQFDDALSERLEPLALLMGGRRARFDEMFYTLLNFSRTSFDDMFRQTYGMIYLQNARVFDDLFTSLESYYRTGRPDISQQMDQFFKKFYQRMFVVYNSQYTFSDQYLSCVLNYMETLQPFGDVPAKFGSSIKRSFVALRTFVRGLNTSASVVRSLLKVNPSKSCVRELMKLTHCSTCMGLPDVRPCLPYCLHVHTHCLHHLHQFTTDWKNFVDAMVTVGDRLLNPFNIENVVRPINLQISDAVMNFQLAGMNISNMIFQGCGQPSLGRHKRDTETDETSLPESEAQVDRQDNETTREGTRGGPGRRRYNGGGGGGGTGGNRGGANGYPRREGGRRRMGGGEGTPAPGQRPRGRGRPGGRGEQGEGGGRRRPVGGGRRGGASGANVGAALGGAAGGGRELSLERLDFTPGGDGRSGEEAPPSINKIIKEIKTKLENSRQFLEEVSPQLCGELASKQDSSCWTGTQLGRSADAVLPQLSPPPPHAGVHEQTYRLQIITRQLQAAANGQDIAWMEEQRINDSTDIDGSGGGSGDDSDDDEDGWGADETRRDGGGANRSRSQGGGARGQPNRPGAENFPPDDEDGYRGAGGSGDGPDFGPSDHKPPYYGGVDMGGRNKNHQGSGRPGQGGPSGGAGAGRGRSRYDDPYDGSGDYFFNNKYPPHSNSPSYPTHNNRAPYDPQNPHPPSGVAKEDMSLTKAITVYLIPAIIMYFGSIG